ncbi:MAG TPA: hypothetical protein VM553_03620, partial [Dongiaceae bacterium]|nr:hypothetical protein [Dongiaceae bacterium]
MDYIFEPRFETRVVEANKRETNDIKPSEVSAMTTTAPAEVSEQPAIDLSNSAYYFNRYLSLLEFNLRVLAQAEDKSLPLLERLRFLMIFSSNMDEFFEIRLAGLQRD